MLDLTTLSGSLYSIFLLTVGTILVCELLNKIFFAWIKGKDWWPRAETLQKALCMNFGYAPEECTEPAMRDSFSFVLVFCGHHFLCGFLTLPVLCFGWDEAGNIGQTMFLLGGVMDVALDIYDILKKSLQLFLPNVAAKYVIGTCPVAFYVVLCCLHHPLAIALVVPMNLVYPQLRAYHYIISSLLFAAGICFLSGQYKFTLDVTKRNDFYKFKAVVLLQLVTLVFTRGYVWYYYSWFVVLPYFYSRGDMPFFYGGVGASVLMSLFNLAMLNDSIQAAIKWLPRGPPESEEEQSELREDIVLEAAHSIDPLHAKLQSEKMIRAHFNAAIAATKWKKLLNKNKAQ